MGLLVICNLDILDSMHRGLGCHMLGKIWSDIWNTYGLDPGNEKDKQIKNIKLHIVTDIKAPLALISGALCFHFRYQTGGTHLGGLPQRVTRKWSSSIEAKSKANRNQPSKSKRRSQYDSLSSKSQWRVWHLQ